MTLDLTWTGNQFLDRRAHTDRVLSLLTAADITTKDDTWSREVAAAVAAHFAIPAGLVRVAAGSTQLIDVVLRSMYRGAVVDVTPNFHLAATLSRQEGWVYHPVPVREPDELVAALSPHLPHADRLIILSSPRNPLGYQFDVADVATLLQLAAGTVVVDEVYADFAADSVLRLVTRYPNLVVVRSFSKAWGLASLRIGFAVSAAFAADGLALRLIPNSVSGIAQRAAQHLLAYPEDVRCSVRAAQACRQRMLAELEQIPALRVWPSQANYVCVETPAAAEVAAALAEVGYLVRLLHDLRGYPPDWPPGIRLTVPPPPHLDAVLAAVGRVLTPGAVLG
jgi:histidinol-phosphate aminotransferase